MLQAIDELGHAGIYGSGIHDDEGYGLLLFPFVEQGSEVRQGFLLGSQQVYIRAEVLSCGLPFAGIQISDFQIPENGLVDAGQLVDFQRRELVLDLCEAEEDIFRSGNGTL